MSTVYLSIPPVNFPGDQNKEDVKETQQVFPCVSVKTDTEAQAPWLLSRKCVLSTCSHMARVSGRQESNGSVVSTKHGICIYIFTRALGYLFKEIQRIFSVTIWPCQRLLHTSDIKVFTQNLYNQLLSKQSTASQWYSFPFMLKNSLA